MRRKLLVTLLTVALCVGGVGCGNASTDGSVEKNSSATEVVITSSEAIEESTETQAEESTVETKESTETSAEESFAGTIAAESTVEASTEASSEAPGTAAPAPEPSSEVPAPAPETTPAPSSEPAPESSSEAPAPEPIPEPSSEAPAPEPEPQPQPEPEWYIIKESWTMNADTHIHAILWEEIYSLEQKEEVTEGAHEWIEGPIVKALDHSTGEYFWSSSYICSVCEYDSARMVPGTYSTTPPQ